MSEELEPQEATTPEGATGPVRPRKVRTNHAKRIYSKRDKAKVLTLLASNGDLDSPQKVVEKALHVPQRTVSAWANGRGIDEKTLDIAAEEMTDLADLYERAVRKGLMSLLQNTDQVTWKDATGIAIFTDKMRLLREQSTSITTSLTLEEKRKRIAELVGKARIS